MKLNLVLLKLEQGYSVRTEQFEGRTHLIAPVIILTEGVHCGSAGCKLYMAEELSALPQAWNGRPLPVFHPENENGEALSANSPELIQQQSVGFLFNTEFVEGVLAKLKSELWIDIEKARMISPETLAIIQARKPLEVSTGLWSFDEETAGEWNGKTYDSIMRGPVPDHLALLPGGLGACSLDDGCGVRANAKGEWVENYDLVTNPFPNEHAARLRPPGRYKRFRRENNKFGTGIHAIWGVRKTDEKVELQAIRFSKSRFTTAQARKWLRDHDHSVILFEPASGQSNQKEGGGEVKYKLNIKQNSRINKVIADHIDKENVRLQYEIKNLSEKEEASLLALIDNELSHGDIRMNLQHEVDKMDNPMRIHFVMEVFDSHFIYRVQPTSEGGETKMFKQSYSVKNNNEVELGEEVDEVRQVVTFEKLNAKEVNSMGEKVKKCCPEKVQALIDNKDSKWTAEDKEMLLALNESQLERLQPIVIVNKDDDESKKKIEELEVENKTLKENAEKKPKEIKFEEVLANAPAHIKEPIEHGRVLFEEQKSGMVSQILGNENCEYTEDELKVMGFSALKKLAKAFRVELDYSVNLGPNQESQNGEEPLVVNYGGDGNGKKKEETAK